MSEIDIIKQSVTYDNGNLIWIGEDSRKRKKGKSLGTKGNHGYLTCAINKKLYLNHRVIFAIHHGNFPNRGMTVDHIDGNKLNNKIENLRLATYSQNLSNKTSHNNTSGAKGVVWNPANQNWRVRINYKKKAYEIGSFLLFDKAVNACITARNQIHQEFAKHN
jgi:hypothetical protein